MPDSMIETLVRYIGRTVTIFTTSGGLSGSGFTGVLASVNNGTVKLITNIGGAPACAVGSMCCEGGWDMGGFGGRGYGGGRGFGFGGGFGSNCGGNFGGGCCGGSNWLGSVTEIPISRIASFVHNAI